MFSGLKEQYIIDPKPLAIVNYWSLTSLFSDTQKFLFVDVKEIDMLKTVSKFQIFGDLFISVRQQIHEGTSHNLKKFHLTFLQSTESQYCHFSQIQNLYNIILLNSLERMMILKFQKVTKNERDCGCGQEC